MNPSPALIVCMGVSGCGKTTVAHTIATETGIHFLEADDFHSLQNKAHMAAGKALDETMRAPWIKSICEALREKSARGEHCVLACSALRRAHRQQFRETGFRTLFLFLDGSQERIADGMRQRDDHFMPVDLLNSQFDTLESPLGEKDVDRIAIDTGWETVTDTAVEAACKIINTSGQSS